MTPAGYNTPRQRRLRILYHPGHNGFPAQSPPPTKGRISSALAIVMMRSSCGMSNSLLALAFLRNNYRQLAGKLDSSLVLVFCLLLNRNATSLIDVQTGSIQNSLEGHFKGDTSGKYIASVSEYSVRVWSKLSRMEISIHEFHCNGYKIPGQPLLARLVIGSLHGIKFHVTRIVESGGEKLSQFKRAMG